MLSNNETTARLICEGLKNLLKTKNLDRIRIKEITDEVGLMRPTFYNYFQDKYEVIEYIFTHEVLEPMRPFLQSGLVKEAFHFMIVAIQKDSEFYRREIMRSSQNSFRDDTRVKRSKCRSCLQDKAFELGTCQIGGSSDLRSKSANSEYLQNCESCVAA